MGRPEHERDAPPAAPADPSPGVGVEVAWSATDDRAGYERLLHLLFGDNEAEQVEGRPVTPTDAHPTDESEDHGGTA